MISEPASWRTSSWPLRDGIVIMQAGKTVYICDAMPSKYLTQSDQQAPAPPRDPVEDEDA